MQKYSFLMSVYFKEKPEYLKLSIESMINQTIKPDEIIIVKDGPLTDELDTIIDNYSADSNLFTIVALSKNRGLGNALNIGIKTSRNELIARMDSDDISFPNRCEKLLLEFNKESELSIVGGQIVEFDGDIDKILPSRVVPCEYEKIVKFARRRSPFNHPTVMYKKSVIEQLGGYPSSGRKEDLDLFLLAISNGYLVSNISSPVLYYRSNIENLKRRKKWSNCKEYIEIIRKYKKRGFCSFFDYFCVFLGQILFFITPLRLTRIINNRFLRKEVNNANAS